MSMVACSKYVPLPNYLQYIENFVMQKSWYLFLQAILKIELKNLFFLPKTIFVKRNEKRTSYLVVI